MTTADIFRLLIQLVIIGMLLRTMAHQRTAVHVARDSKSEAAKAASNAAEAALIAQAILRRIESLGDQNKLAAQVVARDLADAHERADTIAIEEGQPPGAAADAAATTPVKRSHDDGCHGGS